MAESLIYDLCKAVGNMLLDEGNLLLGVPEEACQMEKTLKSIKAVLASAEKKEVTEEDVNLWLRDLKDVAYDIEDVLDDWSIAQLQMQDESAGTSQQQGHKPKGKVCCSCIPTPCFRLKQGKSRHHISHDIKEINERLDVIAKRKNDYGFDKSSVSVKEITKEESTPFDFIYNVPSQKKTKATVIENLVRDDFKHIIMSHDQIPIVSLVGMGGIGKTTLAKLVHDDQIVKEHFSKIIWVCVSDNFSEIKVVKEIADALDLDVTNFHNLTNVLCKIADKIKGLTFLLILDDVWENSEEKWKAILSCMGKGDAHKSRILLTTRSSGFAEKMDAVFTLRVGELSEEDSWSLFRHYAFFGKAREDCNIVEDIAKELAKKCKGLPLALEVLGKFMRTKKIKRLEWKDVLTSKIWETRFKEGVFPSLVLSYLDLPSTVKRCFTFCAIFPKDTVMKKSRLIHLWMAQGYLQGSTTDRMEADGEEYLECLVRRSFFRVTKFGVDHEGDTTVTMHDLVHDFALYVSDGEIAILDPSLEVQKVGGRPKPRHLAFGGEIGESMSLPTSFDIKALRTLFLSTHPTTILTELCSNKSYVRALNIHLSSNPETSRGYGLRDVRRLVHLRYLCLNLSDLIVLPEEICDLRYLQTLDLQGCSDLEKLPTHIGRLTALRHLLFDNQRKLDSLPKGLGKLNSLQTLSCFFSNSLDSENYCNLEDLRELNNLRGNLWLKNLSQVAHVNAATTAELHLKKHIVRLTLEFGDGDALLQSKVLEALKPAEDSLDCLKVRDYRGGRCPQWIGQWQCLKEIELKQVCVECLPALGILPRLQKLKIKSAHKLKYVGEEFLGISEGGGVFFNRLTELTFEDLSLWENWEGPKQEILGSRVKIMPSLRNLTLNMCGKLRALPHFLQDVPNLENLEANGVDLPPVDFVEEEDGPKRLCISDIVLPRTLKYIKVHTVGGEGSCFKEKGNAVDQPEASEVMVQEQQLMNFNYVELHRYNNYRWIVALTTVKEMGLYGVHDEFLPPLGLMPCLEELMIMDAVYVKKVGDEFLGISNNNNRGLGIGNYDEHKGGDRGGAFPRLQKLRLHNFFGWEEWEDPQVQGTDDRIIIMPSLCELSIDSSNLMSLPHFLEGVPLQRLDIRNFRRDVMPRIRHIEDEACKMNLQEMNLGRVINAWVPYWRNYCGNLRVLVLSECSEASLFGLGALPSLENLTVYFCDRIERVGKEVMLWTNEDVEDLLRKVREGRGDTPRRRQSQQSSSSCNTSIVYFPSLTFLGFSYMKGWKEWVDPSQLGESINCGWGDIRYGTNRAITMMPRLRELEIGHCPQLKALPSFLKKVPLRKLVISDCDALETWWENEAGEDWKSKISPIKINYRCLSVGALVREMDALLCSDPGNCY